jgi:hypothetical protein
LAQLQPGARDPAYQPQQPYRKLKDAQEGRTRLLTDGLLAAAGRIAMADAERAAAASSAPSSRRGRCEGASAGAGGRHPGGTFTGSTGGAGAAPTGRVRRPSPTTNPAFLTLSPPELPASRL